MRKRDYPPMDKDHFDPRHPFVHKRYHHPGMLPFGLRRNPRDRYYLYNDLETKEDALDFIELQVKRTIRHQKHLLARIKRLENIEELLNQKIKEIAKMEDYDQDKMKKMLKKIRIEFMKQDLEEDY